MPEIQVKILSQDDEEFVFHVEIAEAGTKTDHTVEVEKSYYDMLTAEKIDPEELVRQSFEFLLKREPKESILRKFNLRVINRYFPEYEQTMKNR